MVTLENEHRLFNVDQVAQIFGGGVNMGEIIFTNIRIIFYS